MPDDSRSATSTLPPPAPSSRGGASSTAGHVHQVDPALELLLRAAEDDAQVGLTVAVNGCLVSGTLISTMSYFRALADQFSSPSGSTVMGELFADSFRSIVDDARQHLHDDLAPQGAGDEQAVIHGPGHEFLHLHDARFIGGQGFFPHGRHGVLWRCRVADVSGWALGDLTG